MKAKRPLPSADLIDELLSYDAASGVFVWKRHRFQTPQSAGKWVGREAGSIGNGYRFIRIPGFFQVGAHRLAWILIHGKIPGGKVVDHIDRNPLNNSISNLRLASHTDNMRNCGPRQRNRFGVKGVSVGRYGHGYRARVSVDGHEIYLGTFSNLEDAAAARKAAQLKYYGEFGGSVYR